MVGVVSLEEALNRADQAGLDLVEISPNADPPVCKVQDYGKLKYQDQKKKSEARKKQKTIDVKEIKMRPNIDIHDSLSRPRDGAPGTRHEAAAAGPRGDRRRGQGRARAEHGRPPDDHGAGPGEIARPATATVPRLFAFSAWRIVRYVGLGCTGATSYFETRLRRSSA